MPPQQDAKFKTVLVAVDFSDDSNHALRVAQERFCAADATLVLVHAVEAEQVLLERNPLHDQVDAIAFSQAQKQMMSLASSLRDGWQETHAVTEVGKPGDVILAAANDWKCDVIVMGSHGKSGLARALFGSTTYHVARKAECSVLVLRPSTTA